jgi:hypothetical protein
MKRTVSIICTLALLTLPLAAAPAKSKPAKQSSATTIRLSGVPGGVSYRFTNAPFELFIEAGLDVAMFPAFGIGASGGLGVRYRF